jgi:hypothetical protein
MASATLSAAKLDEDFCKLIEHKISVDEWRQNQLNGYKDVIDPDHQDEQDKKNICMWEWHGSELLELVKSGTVRALVGNRCLLLARSCHAVGSQLFCVISAR